MESCKLTLEVPSTTAADDTFCDIQSNFDGSNSSGPLVRVRPIHVFERYLADDFQVGSCVLHVIMDTTFFIDQSCIAHVTPVTNQ